MVTSSSTRSAFQIANVRWFILFRVFFNSRFYYPVFTILFLDFGLTLTQFALLNAIWAATIVLLEVPSGALADTFGRRNLVVLAGGCMVVEMALLCVAPRGNPDLLFLLFLINRILSGVAEAAASGADEAIAYDALEAQGQADRWGAVLDRQMRWQSAGFILAMTVGAAVYDPDLMTGAARFLGLPWTFSQETTLRLPVFLTLLSAVAAFGAALQMKDPVSETGACVTGVRQCVGSVMAALKMTLTAGRWILRTPFALAIILAGLMFDNVIRMLMTLNSQYFRLIQLPEASFGLIGAGLALMGMVMPPLALKLTQHRTPLFNLGLLSLMTIAGLAGMAFVIPYGGLVPVAVLAAVMYLLRFFVSHYLNRIADSSRRATVLSFKGLSFNLAYGLAGVLYSLVLAFIRGRMEISTAAAGAGTVADLVFRKSLVWFPLYFIVLLTGLIFFSALFLKTMKLHRKTG